MILPRGTWSAAHGLPSPKIVREDRPLVLRRKGDGALALPAYRQGTWFYVIVSRVDEWASAFNWYVAKNGYAQRNFNKRTDYLHRLVMGLVIYPETPELGLEPTTTVDHRNRLKLDNTRRNLRMLTLSDQIRNQEQNDHESVGVSWDAARGRWQARIKHLGREHFIGRFRSRRAAIARRKEILRKMGLEVIGATNTEPTTEAVG